jgi:hypothetical protein
MEERMKRFMCLLLVAVMGLVILNASVVTAQVAGKDGSAPPASGTRAINNQAAVSCNYCFTCGGDWPTFSGSQQQQSQAIAINRPTERGSGCSGALIQRSDSRPFLCCR